MNGSTSSLAREETNLSDLPAGVRPKPFTLLSTHYVVTIYALYHFGVLLDKWCVGGILQVHRRWLYMNHTKAMLTDILLHLRKRAERGSGLAGAGSTGGSGVLPGPAALRRGPGAFAGGRGPVGRLLRPWRNTPESISFPGPPNGPGVGCVGPAGRGRGGNPLPCPGAFLLVTSTDIRSPSCQRGEMGG